jgi:hypothetical protein
MSISPDLELFVRPFTGSNQPLPRNRIYWNGAPEPPLPTTTDPDSREGVLTWSARADVQGVTLPGMNVRIKEDTNDSDNDLGEVERETSTKRVFNSEDASQYVDVEVVERIVLTNKAKQRRTLRFDNES